MLRVVGSQEYISMLEQQRSLFCPEIEGVVRDVLQAVRRRGDDALFDFTLRWDRVDLRPTGLRVTDAEFDEAENEVGQDLRHAVRVAISNITEYYRAQVPQSWFITRPNGNIVGQHITAIDRVGIYVPGGQAPLVSSLCMMAVPARVAGVPDLSVVTPPNSRGKVAAELLVTAKLCGATDVYKVGGAQAVAALAYGTETIPRVDKIVGPGNLYATVAKKMVYGIVGIDMLAGPSEVCIVADSTADPELLAADLMSQAEHTGGTAVLIATDHALVDKTNQALEGQVVGMSYREVIEQNLGKRGLAVAVDGLDEAIALVNRIAPEHLEIHTAEPWQALTLVRNAGAIFLGRNSPEPIGDYIAGPSNVLPTEGTARYSSGITVETFLKRSSLVAYSAGGFAEDAPAALALARAEGLPAHAGSLAIRINRKEANPCRGAHR